MTKVSLSTIEQKMSNHTERESFWNCFDKLCLVLEVKAQKYFIRNMILVLKKREFYISRLFLELHFFPKAWELREKDGRDASYVLPSATNAILNDEVIGPFNTILLFPLGCCVLAWNFSGEDAKQLRMLSHLIKIVLNHMEGNTSLTVAYLSTFPPLHVYIHQVSIGLKCIKIEKARFIWFILFSKCFVIQYLRLKLFSD